jgi:hypothetical protein
LAQILVVLLIWLPSRLRAQTYSPPPNAREVINLDAGWRFIRQDVP